jgi:cephalosporin hydroxylase
MFPQLFLIIVLLSILSTFTTSNIDDNVDINSDVQTKICDSSDGTCILLPRSTTMMTCDQCNNRSLFDLLDHYRSDKATVHSYIDIYEPLLASRRNTAKNVLEIGVRDGGSIKLWRDYFVNAMVYGLDIEDISKFWQGIRCDPRIILHPSTDAYSEEKFKELFLDTNLKFDMVLDDGPHTLESMQVFIRLYSQLLTEDGILIIEDVQHVSWFDALIHEVPEDLRRYIHIYDNRQKKDRYDDLVFVIDKQRV